MARAGKTAIEPEVLEERIEEIEPPYDLVLLDDQEHTYDYVIEMLQKLFFQSLDQAYQHAVEVDTMGRTVVITCGRAEAEFGRDQILAYGPDWRMPNSKGSMTAIVEPSSQGGSARTAG